MTAAADARTKDVMGRRSATPSGNSASSDAGALLLLTQLLQSLPILSLEWPCILFPQAQLERNLPGHIERMA